VRTYTAVTELHISGMSFKCIAPIIRLRKQTQAKERDNSSYLSHLTSSRPPSSSFMKQWESAWSWMADACPGPQQRIIMLKAPFPASTRFRVYLESKKCNKSSMANQNHLCNNDTFHKMNIMSLHQSTKY
jgi:hypothetical protein